MKKNILHLSCLVLLAFATLVSCNDKGNDVPPAPKTKTQLIAQGTWRFSSATWGGADAGSSLPSCWKDNTMLFTVTASGAGNGTIDEGLTKCNAGDPQTRPYSWTFQTNETILSISTPILPGGGGTFTIVSLTSDQMILSQPYTIGSVTQTAIVTFIH